MKTVRYYLFAFLAVLLSTGVMADNTCFRGSPYLQELSHDGVTVVFENTAPTFAWVELRKKGQTTVTNYYQEVEGQHQVYDYIQAPSVVLPVQNFVIRISGLAASTEYEYRICSQQIDEMKPYSAVFSAEYQSDWYGFRTLNDKATSHSLLVLSDMHNRPAVLEQFLQQLNPMTADHIIYAGDMMDNMQVGKPASSALSAEEPYASFINVSSASFAMRKDFCMLRGDHETKGDAADYFERFFPHQSGNLYNAYRWGDLEVVLLDGGEALPDDDPTARTTMLAAYNPYRQEEARWLQQLIRTDEYQGARYRIVVSHLPIPNPSEEAQQAGARYFADLMLPILNQGNVDLLVCGHLHPDRYIYMEPTADVPFPTLVQGYNSALRIEIADGHIAVKVVGADGTVFLEKTL
ncbi:MAG: metallophosphoesterase [Bacteroidaceae bacterium]|nr:metallophosphoesterase [Bacteroidaceae bacterium]